jgi:hypothetical protein
MALRESTTMSPGTGGLKKHTAVKTGRGLERKHIATKPGTKGLEEKITNSQYVDSVRCYHRPVLRYSFKAILNMSFCSFNVLLYSRLCL